MDNLSVNSGRHLPSGTVTFLFTDVEGSTKLAREHPEIWETARARHHTILRGAIEAHQGYVLQIIGNAFCAAFHTAADAVKAAILAQHGLQNEPWREVIIRVRMGIHTGEAQAQQGEYHGYLTMSMVQRLMSAGYGGQILISEATEKLLREKLPNDVGLRNMGEHRFKDVPHLVCVFQAVVPGLQSEFPHLKTLDARPNNLPAQLTSFIGREKELEEVRKLLQSARMLTLIGPGGTGKTRLSIEAASGMLAQYPDGVWLVELAPIRDPLLVPRTTAIAIGLRDEPQRPIIEMLCDYLREKKLLIILDNCEHLVDACAQMADRILPAAPKTQILASSREALGIGGEVTYRVPSLGLPDVNHLPPLETLSQYEAVKLFIDRATSTVSTFSVTNESAPALAQICHRLDGIPLAIELAAVKIRVLSLEQIAKRLDDRFRLLTGGSRTALERHQTLRAAIDWSYNLLPPAEQILFQRLSVFMDGWTLEAAESICSGGSVQREDILDFLEQLINKSMIAKEEIQAQARYHILETLRQYADEKLVASGESDALRDRHLDYFLNLAETAEPHLVRPEQLEWWARLGADYGNIRQALGWAISKESPEPSWNLCRALAWYWENQYYWVEGLNWVKKAITKPYQHGSRPEKKARAQVLYTHAQFVWRVDNNIEMISSSAQDSLALASEVGDRRDIAIAKFYVGVGLSLQGEDDQAFPFLEESFTEFQALNDLFWQAKVISPLNFVLLKQGKLRAQDETRLALEFARRAGERVTLQAALLEHAWWLARANRIDEAKKYAEEADKLDEEIGLQSISASTMIFADIAWLKGDTGKARELYMKERQYFDLLGEIPYKTFFTTQLGLLAMDDGELDQARLYLEQALVDEREHGLKLHIAKLLADLSILSYLQGNFDEFKRDFKESLSFKDALADMHKAYLLMTILGALYAQNPESSARLLGVIRRHSEQENAPNYMPFHKRYWRPAETHIRATLGDAAFEDAFRDGQKMTLDEALDLALITVEEM